MVLYEDWDAGGSSLLLVLSIFDSEFLTYHTTYEHNIPKAQKYKILTNSNQLLDKMSFKFKVQNMFI
jgi:hypothetical protein